MGSLGEAGVREFGNPVFIQLNRLENLLKEKERELGAAQNEIKALKGSEFLKDKAVVELNNELNKLEQKLRSAEKQIEDKNLEIKKLIGEKKAALSAQFAAESTLRRMHAGQRDDDLVTSETLIAPLEAEVKMCKTEIASLREDKKALDRLMKSKEIALVEIEKKMKDALERALMVDNLQNQNVELKRQVEICQEENKFLEKTNRQKVIEVDKLMQTIRDLEECILVGGQTANVVRDYERQVTELNEERKLLERDLAKAKICANRVATVVANEWKDENEKVMPVKQWLEERRFLQGEIQRLKDKLTIAERSSRAEAQLKDKIKLRLRTLEENFKQKSTSLVTQITNSGPKFRISSSNLHPKRSSSQPRASASKVSANRSVDDPKSLQGSNKIREKFVSSENVVRDNSCASSTSKMYDEETTERLDDCHDDMVSGFLYDRLQKEIIALRKSQGEKDEKLSAKDDDIKLLQRKVEALTKSMEMESKNMRRAAAVREKEVVQKSEATKQQNKTSSVIRRNLKPGVSAISKA